MRFDYRLARLVHPVIDADARRERVPVIDVVVFRRHLSGRPGLRIEARKRGEYAFAVVVAHAEIDHRPAETIGIVDVQPDRPRDRARVIRQLGRAGCRSACFAVRQIQIVVSGERVGAVADELKPGLPFMCSAQDFARQVRELRLKTVAPTAVLAPLRDAARDEAGVLIFITRLHARHARLVWIVRAVQPEAGVTSLDECLVRQHAGIHDVWRRIVAMAEPDGTWRRELRRNLRDEVVVVVVAVEDAMVRRDVVVELPEHAPRIVPGRCFWVDAGL